MHATLLAYREQDMTIDLELGMQPPSRKLYPLSSDELELLKEYQYEILKNSIICTSKSSVNTPILFAKQANSNLHIVVAYHGLHVIKVKHKYHQPNMTTLIEQLGLSQIFSKLDLKLGYNLVRIAKGDKWKIVYKTPYGLNEYAVMIFGLTNAPFVFQLYLNNILRKKIDLCVVILIDDVLIYSKTEEEYIELVRWVLQKLTENNLCINIDKYLFVSEGQVSRGVL